MEEGKQKKKKGRRRRRKKKKEKGKKKKKIKSIPWRITQNLFSVPFLRFLQIFLDTFLHSLDELPDNFHTTPTLLLRVLLSNTLLHWSLEREYLLTSVEDILHYDEQKKHHIPLFLSHERESNGLRDNMLQDEIQVFQIL